MSPEIIKWAIRHGIGLAAIHELENIFGLNGTGCTPLAKGDSEQAVQAEVRLEAARKGMRLFRNNVGALKDIRGVPVRYGLANDSKELNEVIKSADLIGWRPIIVTQELLGQRIAQFVSVECKDPNWKYKGDAHEKAQLAWAQLVISGGGEAKFVNGTGML